MSAYVLEGRGLTKVYDGVTVVEDVSLSVAAGEILAVIGENGAGKSTLMNMLTGVIRPDAGEVRFNGEALVLHSPRHAAATGIAIVHQELQLVPLQSVADNLMLVRPPRARNARRGGREEASYVRSMLGRVGLDVEPKTSVAELSVAQCQMLEIAKALALDAHVIILDEPTAALLPAEAERLLRLIEGLRRDGKAILYISHALDEVLRLSDRISVLRDGRVVGEYARNKVDRSCLIQAMVDRPVGLYAYERPQIGGRVVLEARQIATPRARHISFELRAGEILGFAGLMGCGMHEAALALCGDKPITAGTLLLDGTPIRFRSPNHATRAGVVIVPEERKREGIVPALSIMENMHLGRYGHYAHRGLIDPVKLRNAASELACRFQIRLASLDQPIATLSGGNQQKALIARCVQSNPKVLIISSPTRGVDIGAKEAIHKLILELAAQGTAIILVSPELDELLGLAHRVAVFAQGQLVSILSQDEATPSRILELALGDAHARKTARAA